MIFRLAHYITIVTLCMILMACASGKSPAPSTLKAASQSEAESLRIATFNIHYLHVTEKGLSKWKERRTAVTDMIGDISPDIIAFQEMESFGGGHSRNENIWIGSYHNIPASNPLLIVTMLVITQLRSPFFTAVNYSILSSKVSSFSLRRRMLFIRALLTVAIRPFVLGPHYAKKAAVRALPSLICILIFPAGQTV